MNSRDRLRGGELCKEAEQELEDLMKNHAGLRALRDRRAVRKLNRASRTQSHSNKSLKLC